MKLFLVQMYEGFEFGLSFFIGVGGFGESLVGFLQKTIRGLVWMSIPISKKAALRCPLAHLIVTGLLDVAFLAEL